MAQPTYNPNVPLSEQQAFIVNAFQSDSYIKGMVDVQHEPIYDTVTVAQSATITSANQFFTNVGANANKQLNQTNLQFSNELKEPEAFAIFQYRFYIAPTTSLADAEAVMAGFALQFVKGNKPYQTVPLWMIPAGGGLSVSTTATTTTVISNGWPTSAAARTLAITLVIEAGDSFYAQLVGPSYTVTGANGVTMVLALDGLHARAIS